MRYGYFNELEILLCQRRGPIVELALLDRNRSSAARDCEWKFLQATVLYCVR